MLWTLMAAWSRSLAFLSARTLRKWTWMTKAAAFCNRPIFVPLFACCYCSRPLRLRAYALTACFGFQRLLVCFAVAGSADVVNTGSGRQWIARRKRKGQRSAAAIQTATTTTTATTSRTTTTTRTISKNDQRRDVVCARRMFTTKEATRTHTNQRHEEQM